MRIDPGMIYQQLQTGKTEKAQGQSMSKSAAGLKAGDILKGQIVDASQSKVTLQLSNGQVLSARLETTNIYAIGDQVTFMVKEAGNEQVLLTALKGDQSNGMMQLNHILAEAGLPQNEANQQLVKAMIEQNMSIGKEHLKNMVRMMNRYPEAPVRQLLFLTKHHMPINENNLNQLKMLEQNEQPLLKSVASLVDDLSSNLTGKAVTTKTEGLASLNAREAAVLNAVTQDRHASMFQSDINRLLTALGEQVKARSYGTEQVSQQTPIQEGIVNSDHVPLKSEGIPMNQMLLGNDLERLGNELVNRLTVAFLQQSPESAPLLKALPDFGLMTLGDLQTLSEEGLITHEQLRDFLIMVKEGSTYQSLAKGILISDTSIIGDGKVNEYFNELQDKVNALMKLPVDSTSTETVTKGAGDVKGTLTFMNSLQQDYNFMHLPMFINDQLQNSELYIMNNKKNQKDPKGSITALVRLDLLNLGHTDIFVKKVAKNVEVQFFMEDARQISVMQENVYQLHKLLNNKGFNVLSATVQPLESSFDPVEDFFDQRDEGSQPQRFSFDMRA